MATFLDVGILGYFGIIFAWLFIFVVLYAGLNKFALLTDDKGLNAIIALCLSVGILFTKQAIDLVLITVPWFVVVIIMVFFILTVLMFMGVSQKTISDYMGREWSTPQWAIFVVLLSIIAIGSVVVFGNKVGPYSGGNEALTAPSPTTYETTTVILESGENVTITQPVTVGGGTKYTLFHPKVLGLMLLLLIAFFAFTFIVPYKKDK